MIDNACQFLLIQCQTNPKISENEQPNWKLFCWMFKRNLPDSKNNYYLTVWTGGPTLFVMDVLLFFFSIGGLLVLSLLDDERFVGSAFSMSNTFLLIKCASGQCLATLCKSAVVDDVLNKPNARRRNPWLKHASTAAHNDVTEADCSCTNFRVTASSITCFTSFFTVATSRSLKSSASIGKREREKKNWTEKQSEIIAFNIFQSYNFHHSF